VKKKRKREVKRSNSTTTSTAGTTRRKGEKKVHGRVSMTRSFPTLLITEKEWGGGKFVEKKKKETTPTDHPHLKTHTLLRYEMYREEERIVRSRTFQYLTSNFAP